ncbi:MAG: transcription antitermination factor NusB [Rhodospirillaceae bacterium]|jgi:transcription antitermination protein NusB|nr:transcription antitermination factor NusB [Rhodospirillaceae bacterium]MBT5374210.1 transcription antitermination factor NusB [Rhodospirillaceae bacterium]MBT5658637.1 transcription antitermination factor NusB [Rhodospirillaceae bacterium]MBT5753122.1 transcription antitermination factor NusB [Rhodospirillaceae bacterium]
MTTANAAPGKGASSRQNKKFTSSGLLKGRSAARLAAVQALYQTVLTDVSPDQVILEFTSHRLDKVGEGTEADGVVKLTNKERALFRLLVSGVSRRVKEIDEMITPNLRDDWSPERVPPLLLSALRAGVFEFLECADVPVKVVINEYVNLAHAFYEGQEPAFVNAVLDRIGKVLRKDELENSGGDRQT